MLLTFLLIYFFFLNWYLPERNIGASGMKILLWLRISNFLLWHNKLLCNGLHFFLKTYQITGWYRWLYLTAEPKQFNVNKIFIIYRKNFLKYNQAEWMPSESGVISVNIETVGLFSNRTSPSSSPATTSSDTANITTILRSSGTVDWSLCQKRSHIEAAEVRNSLPALTSCSVSGHSNVRTNTRTFIRMIEQEHFISFTISSNQIFDHICAYLVLFVPVISSWSHLWN